jgi:hypothetical protein
MDEYERSGQLMAMANETSISSRWVIYTCKAKNCAVEQRVDVRPRGDTEDVIAWVQDIPKTVANHHSLNFPGCPEYTCDLKIPIRPEALR